MRTKTKKKQKIFQTKSWGLKTKDKINKYKNLLISLNESKEEENEGNLEMEISWEPNLKDMAEDMVNKRERNKDMSAFEQSFNKKKEKRKHSKNKINSGTDESEDDHISDQTINQKSIHKERHKKKSEKSNEVKDPNLELLFMDSSDVSDRKHFNYKNIVENETNTKKRKQKSVDSFKVSSDKIPFIDFCL